MNIQENDDYPVINPDFDCDGCRRGICGCEEGYTPGPCDCEECMQIGEFGVVMSDATWKEVGSTLGGTDFDDHHPLDEAPF